MTRKRIPLDSDTRALPGVENGIHVPMHKHTASSVMVVRCVLPIFQCGTIVGLTNRIQATIDKHNSFSEPGDEVLVIDVIHWDVKVLVAFDELRVIVEVPVNDREDVCDVTVG